MISLNSRGQTTDRLMMPSQLDRVRQAFLWPFTHRYAAPIWFVLRLYAGWIWLQFGINKLQSGWLTSDPIGGIFKYIAKGTLPVPFAPFRDLATWMLDAGITPYISHAMPFLELAVGLAFISGVLLVPAAIGGTLLVLNIILSGAGSFAFDMRMITINVLLIMAFRVSSLIGFERLAVRILTAAIRPLRTALAARSQPKNARRA